MNKIAILYICTGKYDVFWEGFYNSCEKMFFPDVEKNYYVFTDSRALIETKNKGIQCFYQKKNGWPYDTLLRYNWICMIQDKLRKYDACFFMNSNSQFLRRVDQSVIPLPTPQMPLVFWIHSHNYDDYTGLSFHPERNPISTAYIPEGEECRAYGGGFWGGTGEAIVEMCCTLRDRIAQDLNNGYIAVWHDQSHLEKYGSEHEVFNIPNGIIASEENADLENVYMIFRDKRHFGGNDSLRDVSFREKIKHFPKNLYRKFLGITKGSGIDKALIRLVQRFKR